MQNVRLPSIEKEEEKAIGQKSIWYNLVHIYICLGQLGWREEGMRPKFVSPKSHRSPCGNIWIISAFEIERWMDLNINTFEKSGQLRM